MSPAGFYTNNSTNAWSVYGAGYIFYNNVSYKFGVCPVISLNAGLPATGTGTADDPYVIQMS